MQDFNAKDWQAATGKTKIPIEDPTHQIEVHVSCFEPVQLLGVRGKTKIPLRTGTEFTCKARTQGFDEFLLQGPPNSVTYGYRIHVTVKQNGDPINHENPASPPMPGASNLILQMRNVMQQELNRTRPPYLDPEDIPFHDKYTIDEDDHDFEEEIYAKALAKAKEPKPKEPIVDPIKVEEPPKTGKTVPPVTTPPPVPHTEPPATVSDPL